MNPSDIFKSTLSAGITTGANALTGGLYGLGKSLYNTFSGGSQAAQPVLSSSSSVSNTPKSSATPALGSNPAATSPSTPKTDYINSQTGLTGSTAPSTSTYNPNANYYGGQSNSPSSAMSASTPSTSTGNDAYRTAFEEYYKSLLPSSEETQASKFLADLNLQNEKDQVAAREKGYTTGFKSGEEARVARNNSFQITAASNALNALTGNRTANTNATKARLDFEKSLIPDAPEGFTLSEGQTRYDAQGKPIANVPKSTSGGGSGTFDGTLSPLAQAVQDGFLTIDKVPAANRAQVASELAASDALSPTKQQASQTVSVINDLLSTGGYKNITGLQNPANFLLGGTFSGNSQALNQYDQLQGMLKLGIRGLLKGQGAVSDYEGRILSQAASALGRNLSDEAFATELKKIRGVIQTNAGGETEVIVIGKDGKPLGQGSLTGQEIYDAVKEGNTIQYL